MSQRTTLPTRARVVAGSWGSRSLGPAWRSSTRRSSTSRCRTSARLRRLDELSSVGPERIPADARVADPARRVARRPPRAPAECSSSASALFTAASLLCAIAPNVEMLIAARLLQGIGGALLTPGSLAMIEASFRRADRPRAIGAWSGMAGVATALGPLVGGYLIEAVSWRATFLINLPLGVVVIAAAPTSRRPATRPPPAGSTRRRAPRSARARRDHLRADRGPGGMSGLVVRARSWAWWRWSAFFLAERRSPNSDAAARHVRLAPVQRRQPGHVRRLRGARRLLLPVVASCRFRSTTRRSPRARHRSR